MEWITFSPFLVQIKELKLINSGIVFNLVKQLQNPIVYNTLLIKECFGVNVCVSFHFLSRELAMKKRISDG